MDLPQDLTNKRFGRLTVISLAEKRQRYIHGVRNGFLYIWRCKCDCGKVVEKRQCNLLSGHTKSCGCLFGDTHTTSLDMSGHRLYKVWKNIKKRCFNQRCWNYKNYGGRGITICDEWKNDFPAFCRWSYKNGYNEEAPTGKCEIDRIDNNKGYSPENCRWVSRKIQSRNRRSNINITIKGVTQCLEDWCQQHHIRRTNVYQYMKNHSVDYKDALDVLINKKWDNSLKIWVDK